MFKAAFPISATSMIAADRYPNAKNSHKPAAHQGKSHLGVMRDSAYEGTAILGRACSTVVSTLLNGIAQVVTDASNSTASLSRLIDKQFDKACYAIRKTTTKAIHQQECRRIAIHTKSKRSWKRAMKRLGSPPASTWLDSFKYGQIALLRANQYLCKLAFGEFKECIDDPTNLCDHFVLTGNQLIPDHFYNALNAVRASSIYYGADGVGVLPCETTEQILESKYRFGILEFLYSFFG